VWADKKNLLRDPSARAYIKRFFVSVTEEEFSRGLLWVGEEDQKHKTLVFRRTIAGLENHAADHKAKNFIDITGNTVDAGAQKLLHEQLRMTPEHVRTFSYDPISWAAGSGIDPAIEEHAAYLRNFLDDFCQAMMHSLCAGAEKLAVTPDPVVEETTQHLRFALVRAASFKSTDSTRQVEEAARKYLASSDVDGKQGKALVIYGRSGAGKTYLQSRIMQKCLVNAHAAGGVVVIRFLGTTPRSSSVHALLTSLCQQLRRAYGKDKEADNAVPSDFKDLKAYFQQAVTEWPTPDRPLTLFIDSVDQLDDSNAGRQLGWLPVTELPAYVHVVVSTLPDVSDYDGHFRCLSILKAKLGDSASSNMVEVQTISEPEMVLMHLLQLKGRTLTDKQRRHVLEAFEKRTEADAAGTPLWLTIVAQSVAPWASYDGIPFDIKPAVRDLITDLFERLQKDHGHALVRAALAYITLTTEGVSETELLHLLSLNDDVLADV
jgi:hypothetical protein